MAITYEKHMDNVKKAAIAEAVRRRVVDMLVLLQLDLKKVPGIKPREAHLCIQEEVEELILKEIHT
jgi:hypothetical protein